MVISHRHMRGSELTPLYWNIFLRGLGISLISIFSSLFIFFIGKERWGIVGGIKLVLVFIIMDRTCVFFESVWVTKLIERIGFGRSVLVGSILMVGYLLLPVMFGSSLVVLFFMILLVGPATLFYWTARLSILSLDGEKEKYGDEVGLMTILETGAGVLAPLVGGIILQKLGFSWLYGIGALVVFLSTLPLLRFKLPVPKDGVSWREFSAWMRDSRMWHVNLSFVGVGISDVVNGFFWPIFIYLSVVSFEVLGGLITVTTLLSILVVFVAGKLFDKERSSGEGLDNKVLYFASLILGTFRGVRGLFGGLGGLFSIDLAMKVVAPFHQIPYDSYMYIIGKQRNTLKFYTYREMIYSLGIVSLALVGLAVCEWGGFWNVIFVLSGAGVVVSGAIGKQKMR